jgi:predicted glycoside hydrolase/deacetylase ChbG (UPF0249 family)
VKRLIINADDFGMTAGCDRAIIEAIEAGAVTSTSCLVYQEPWLPPSLYLRAGVHLRLTSGGPVAPLVQVPSLINTSGRFPLRPVAVMVRPPEPAEVRIEWEAQIDSFEALNAPPTHLDSHHHVHAAPSLWDTYADLCARHNAAGVPLSDEQRTHLRARNVACADFAEVRWTDGEFKSLAFLLLGDFACHDTVHLMTHPGYVDEALRAVSTATTVRRAEFDLLMQPEFRAWLQSHQIEVITYAGL